MAENGSRERAEQRYVVVLKDGRVVGTPAGGPLTRDAAWLTERWYSENKPELAPKAVKIVARLPEER